MWKYRCQNGRICVSGVEVLRYRISLPEWEEFEAVSSVYGEIADRSLSFCETTLRQMAEAEFEASEDPRKKFRFPAFRYRLEGRVTYEDAQMGIASVFLIAEMKRGDRADYVERHAEAHTWNLSEGLLLPPEQVVALRCPTERVPKKLRREDGILIDGESLFLIRGAERRELILTRGSSKKRMFAKKANQSSS